MSRVILLKEMEDIHIEHVENTDLYLVDLDHIQMDEPWNVSVVKEAIEARDFDILEKYVGKYED